MRAAVWFLLAAAALAQPPDLLTRPPAVLQKTTPQYTGDALRHHVEGTVVLYVEIGTDGRVHNIRVIQPLGSGLDEKAIEAVRHWRFAPGLRKGKPVRVPATLEVNFRLPGARA